MLAVTAMTLKAAENILRRSYLNRKAAGSLVSALKLVSDPSFIFTLFLSNAVKIILTIMAATSNFMVASFFF
jgi:hypothetical protein